MKSNNNIKLAAVLVSLLFAALACTLTDIGEEILEDAVSTYYVSLDGNDSNDCATPETACLTINGAIQKADNFDVINVAAGIYREYHNPATAVLVNKNVALQGAGVGVSTIRSDGSSAAIRVQDAAISISGFTITNAEFGMEVEEGSNVEAEDVQFRNNTLVGIRVSLRASAHLTNVRVIANGAAAEAAWIARDGLVSDRADATGIINRGSLTIIDSRISRNATGGLINMVGGTITIIGSSLDGNNGAGFTNEAHAVVEDSSFTNNAYPPIIAEGAAGISQHSRLDSARADLRLTNSTISGNQGAGLRSNSSIYVLRHVTISNNGEFALLVNNGDQATLQNVLIGPHAGNDCLIGTSSSYTTQGANIDTDGTCELERTISPSDLGLLPLANNGGGTLTHALNPLPISPAIDTADPAYCPDADQRGVSRPYNLLCDVGAFESEEVEPPELISLEGSEIPELITITPTPAPSIPTINTDTLCWKGPGPAYDVISSVQVGVELDLLGVGEIKNWLVIDNPRFPGVPCWLNQEDVDLDPNFDLRSLTIFPVPLLPTPTPTPTPTLTPTPTPVPPPAAPTVLSAKETECNTTDGYIVELTWIDNADNEDGYRIYHNGNLIATLGANAVQYITADLGSGGEQNFYVEAFNVSGTAQSNTALEDGCIF